MAFNNLMHERNMYKERPDFAKIALDYPEFRKYTIMDAKGKVRVDFNNPEALRMLTKILLKKDFNLTVEIPKGFLIPTVPQRLNYILWIEDLLTVLPNINNIPRGIDIGCGPCAIFSILGAKKNGWLFTSTETSDEALKWASTNISANELNKYITVLKVSPNYTLKEVLSSNEEKYDFCLCNPPFFESLDEIRHKNDRVKETLPMIAKHEEIIAEGGEVAFVKKIIDESFEYRDRVRLYTSMFGKKKSFQEIWNIFQNMKDVSFTKSQFCQGNTVRWSIAWTFKKNVNFEEIERPKPKKPKKAKPPLIYHVPKDIKCVQYNVHELSKGIWNILEELEIQVKVVRSYEYYTESLITTDKNTWSNQRRKRREQKRNTPNSPEKNSKTSDDPATSKSMLYDNVKIANEEKSENDICNQFNMEVLDIQSTKRKFLTENSGSFPKRIKGDTDYSDNNELTDRNAAVFSTEGKNSNLIDSGISVKTEKAEATEISSSFVTCHIEDFTNVSSIKQEKGDENIISINSDSTYTNYKKDQDSKDNWESMHVDSNVEPEPEHKSYSSPSFNNTIDSRESDKVNATTSSEHSTQIDDSETSTVAMKSKASSSPLKDQKAFVPKSLLFCTLKIRRAKDFVLFEMHCPSESNHETMHQVFQYLKNKLV